MRNETVSNSFGFAVFLPEFFQWRVYLRPQTFIWLFRARLGRSRLLYRIWRCRLLVRYSGNIPKFLINTEHVRLDFVNWRGAFVVHDKIVPFYNNFELWKNFPKKCALFENGCLVLKVKGDKL